MKLFSALALTILVGCVTPDRQMSYLVDCGTCRVRYSLGDSIAEVHVSDRWTLKWNTDRRMSYSIHVDQISGSGAAYLRVQHGEETKHVDVCEFNKGCELQYVGVTDVP
jgi:hypothetical protein